MSALATVSEQEIRSLDPRDGTVVGTVPVMAPSEVRDAVAAAHETAARWGALDVRERCRALLHVRQALVDHAQPLAETLSAETGKPLADASFEVLAGATLLTYAIRTGPRALRPRRVPTAPMVAKRAWVEYAPYGVVGMISPWNYPIGIPFQVLPSALVSGNAVVMKPSELTPITAQLLAEVFDASGHDLVRVVTGAAKTGDALVRSDIGKLAFTGSAGTARRILAAAAERLTPVVMELGGKDPMIVTDGADIANAAKSAVGATFSNAGQTCMAVERVFVTPGAYDQFVDAVVAETAEIRQGSGPTDHIGPMTQPGQPERLAGIVNDATDAGARVLAGGKPRRDLGDAYFEPTVLVDVDPSMPVMREETFGPILPIMRVRDLDEAVELANDCDYGLSSSVFASDRDQSRAIASRLVTGGVNLEDALVGSGIPALPFGGVKDSGFGRLQGEEGIREFCHVRSVVETRFPRMAPLAASMFTGTRPSPEIIRRAAGVLYGVGVRNRLEALLGRR